MKKLLRAIIDNTIIGIAAIFVIWPLIAIVVSVIIVGITILKLFGV